MTADYHLHSYFSGDSKTPTEAMVKEGVARGLSLLCLTEHLDLDYPYSDTKFDLDTEAYFQEMRQLQDAYRDQLEIRVGAELGLQPHLGDAYRSWLSDRSFDFLIGSTHLVDRLDPYYPDFWASFDASSGIARYLDVTLQNIRAFDDFDVYGHIDYIVRYIPQGERVFSYKRHAEQVDAILRLLIEKGKGIEINTGGYKAGLSEPNPCHDVLRRYRELGGEIITMGSDAHTTEYVAYRFEDAREVLRECGFRYLRCSGSEKPSLFPYKHYCRTMVPPPST